MLDTIQPTKAIVDLCLHTWIIRPQCRIFGLKLEGYFFEIQSEYPDIAKGGPKESSQSPPINKINISVKTLKLLHEQRHELKLALQEHSPYQEVETLIALSHAVRLPRPAEHRFHQTIQLIRPAQ